MEKDSVCGMDVDPKAALSATHDGKTYYFCSVGCQRQFEAQPAKYATA